MNEEHQDMHVLLITGPAGSGRTTAINALEDAGFEAIDNIPLSLAPRLFEGPKLDKPLALGIDTRNRDFSIDGLLDAISAIQSTKCIKLSLLYLDCSVDVLLRRFSETRRRHHLAPKGSAHEGIHLDLDLMQPVRSRSDFLIDTTELSPNELRAEITQRFSGKRGDEMAIFVQSFSYKRGPPRGLDMMFDCRFLRNPHWDKDLRMKNGLNEEVQAYVAEDEKFAPFCSKILGLADLVVPAHKAEGRSHLSIGFGCTGGKHRSVTMVENVCRELHLRGWHVTIRHRELDRSSSHKISGKTKV